ncbi:MAG: cytochrome c biogenesis protein ResB [Bacteriovoracaceae bacterium]|nr:cytochrome c biogenesis protein ResB [Bacteriovoracaceae bacterium]
MGSLIFPFENAGIRTITGVILGLLLAFINPLVWDRLVNISKSKKFIILLMAISMMLTLLGTFIIQKATTAEYFKIYGKFASQILFYLSFQDLFNSSIFITCLTLIGISIGVYLVYKKNTLSPRDIGITLIHLAVIFIFIGAMVGKILADKGVLALSIGDVSDQYQSQIKSSSCNFDCATSYLEFQKNINKGFLKKLPLTIRLDQFKIENYPTEYRMYLLHFNHKLKTYETTTSWAIKEMKKGSKPQGTNLQIKEITLEKDNFYKLIVKDIGDDKKQKVMRFNTENPNIITLDQSKKALTIAKKSSGVKKYLSKVTLLNHQKNIVSSYDILVNRPLILGSYYIFQSSYDSQNKNLSIFEIVYDPGVVYVFTGFFLLTVGVLLSLFSRVRTL